MENEKRKSDFSFSCKRIKELLEIREVFYQTMRCVSWDTALYTEYLTFKNQLEKTIAEEAKCLIAAL